MKKYFLTIITLCLVAGFVSATMQPGDELLCETQSLGGDGTIQNVRADGKTWNQIDYMATKVGILGNLILSDGTDESINVYRTIGAIGTKYAPKGLTNLSWVASDVLVDVFQYSFTGDPCEYRIEGLSASFLYNVRMACGGNNNVYENQSNTVQGVVGANSADYNPWVEGNSATPKDMSWSGVALDGSGYLNFKVVGNGGERSTSGVIQIVAIPEPVLLGFVALAGLAFIRRR